MLPSFLIATFALAQPGEPSPSDPGTASVAIDWQAPGSCPTRESVESAVVEASGAAIAAADGASVVTETVVEAEADGFRATVSVRRGSSTDTRVLQTEDCVLLARAVAIVIAVALDPVAVATQFTPEPEPKPEPEPEPEPITDPLPITAPEPITEPEPITDQPPAPPPRRSSSREDLPLEYGAGLALGVGGRVLPGAGVGFALSPFVGIRRVHARAVVQYWLPRTQTLPNNLQAGGRFQLAAAGVRLCPNVTFGPAPDRVRLPLCAGVDFGALLGSGAGDAVQAETNASAFWSAVTLEAGAAVVIAPRVSLFAAFEGAISLSRPRFFLENGGELHESARFGPRGLIGIQVHNRRKIP